MRTTLKHYFSSTREPVKYNPLPFLFLLFTKKCVFCSQNKVFFVPFLAHVCLFLALLGPIFFGTFGPKSLLSTTFLWILCWPIFCPKKGGGGTPLSTKEKNFLFSHWFSVKGGGYPPIPLKKKSAKKRIFLA